MIRVSPADLLEINPLDDITMHETTTEPDLDLDEEVKGGDPYQTPEATIMLSHQTEIHLESPWVANHREIFLHGNHREVQKA